MEYISILVYYLDGLETIESYNSDHPNDKFSHSLAVVDAMSEDCYLVHIPIEKLDNLDLQISYLNGDLQYLGCWGRSGEKVVFDGNKEYRNYNKSLFIEKLLPKEDGVPYSEQDFQDVKIGIFAGWGYRDLS
jgi:hypothetical protein